MATRIRQFAKPHLYIDEWFESLGVNDEIVGGRIGENGVSRTTIWRWRREQHRLDPGKIAALADALKIKPEDFYRLPSPKPERPSIDKLLEDADDEAFQAVIAVARQVAGKAR